MNINSILQLGMINNHYHQQKSNYTYCKIAKKPNFNLSCNNEKTFNKNISSVIYFFK